MINYKKSENFSEKDKNYNEYLLNDNKIIETDPKSDVLNNSISIENSIRKDLENDLGMNLLNKVYEVINKSVNDDILNFDFNLLANNLKSSFKSMNQDENIIELSINKIPDIYFLILKERQKIECYA